MENARFNVPCTLAEEGTSGKFQVQFLIPMRSSEAVPFLDTKNGIPLNSITHCFSEPLSLSW